MQEMPQDRAIPVLDDPWLEAEIASILEIYDRLFADRALTILLYEGRDPVWSAPVVTETALVLRHDHLTPDYLGCLERPGPHPGAPGVTVQLRVPRKPRPGETGETHEPWVPQRRLRVLFDRAPTWYEELRYIFEMRRKRAAEASHVRHALPHGRGLPALAPARAPAPDRRPAILIGMHWLEVGGAEKLGFDCIGWALAAGLRVFVVASVASLQRLAHKLPDHPDVTFLRLDRYLPRAQWAPFLARLVAQENIRLIHIHHCLPLYEILPHLRQAAPWLQVIDSSHIIEYADGGYPRIAGVWSNYIDILHVISRELVDYYRDHFQLLGQVRLGRMLTRPAAPVALPPLHLTPGQKTLHVAFVGRYFYQKRPIVVVQMLQALDRWAQGAGVTLTGTMVGEGPFAAAIAGLLRRHGLEGRITMLGAGTDVPGLLARSDILLLPSNNEGLALVCYEAVEQGCIPLSTDVGSQREIVPADLLLPLSPRAGVRAVVGIVERLWRDGDFLARQQAALHDAFNRLMADPTAEEIMMPLYRAAAGGGDTGDQTIPGAGA